LGTHKDLDIWKESITLVTDIYTITKKFPDSEKFALSSQLQRAIVSVPSNIAEGAARQSDKEYLKHLYIASGSLAEVETQIIIANNLVYIEKQDIIIIEEKINILARKISSFIKYLKGISK